MRHSEQVLKLLQKQIGNENEVNDIQQTAEDVVSRWVNPLSGGVEETNGLVYGLVQSGKTGVLSVTSLSPGDADAACATQLELESRWSRGGFHAVLSDSKSTRHPHGGVQSV